MDKYSTYDVVKKIGKGSFGEVYHWCDPDTDHSVAVKKISFENDEGLPSLVVREISLMKDLNHSNIVRLLDVLEIEDGLQIVLEYMDSDLDKFMKNSSEFDADPQMKKRFLFQILQGVAYCHSRKILHRDLKPSNLLVSENGEILKITDFGLAKAFDSSPRTYTDDVGTLVYRAPEILLRCPQYCCAVDIWSVGCIFAEMVTQTPLFKGWRAKDVLVDIFRMIGVPTEENWPGVSSLSAYNSAAEAVSRCDKRALAEVVTDPCTDEDGFDPVGLDLLSQMLHLYPEGRITAEEALMHPYLEDVAAECSSSHFSM